MSFPALPEFPELPEFPAIPALPPSPAFATFAASPASNAPSASSGVPGSIQSLIDAAEAVAESMTLVATNIAMLGMDGNADEQMRVITTENAKVLDYIRSLYHLPPAPSGPTIAAAPAALPSPPAPSAGQER